MRNKINKSIIMCILAVLIVVAGVCVYKYIGSGGKETKTAKSYITMLIDNDMINNEVNMKKCKSSEKKDPSKTKEYYSVTVDNYAIDIDAKYNVIGFNNLNCKAESDMITVEDAKRIAEGYIKKLYDSECEFKEIVKEEEAQKIPYYTLIFAKCKDAIPFYSYNLSLKINKESGMLDGFSNSSIDIEPKESVVLLSADQAQEIVRNAFSKLNTFINFDEKTYKSYSEDKDKTELELCYVVTIKGIDSSGKDVKMKYFVSTETGNIINSERNNVSTVTS